MGTLVNYMQNGVNPKDVFNPIEELRRARAANAGDKLINKPAKEEAVLGAALQAHGEAPSTSEEDNLDVRALSYI